MTDANDNAPQFTDHKLEFIIDEGFYNRSHLANVHAVDYDIGRNAKITYSIVGGSEGQLIFILLYYTSLLYHSAWVVCQPI